jgi:hypothetical protein
MTCNFATPSRSVEISAWWVVRTFGGDAKEPTGTWQMEKPSKQTDFTGWLHYWSLV